MQTHQTDITLASVPIAIGFAKLIEYLTQAQPILAGASYIVAILAGIITIYYKIRNKG